MVVRDVVVKEVVAEETWFVVRKARVEEVEVELAGGGKAVRYRTIIWDEPREPFVTTFFNDPVPALDLMERIVAENRAIYDKEVERDGS
jgi:hypothetical protein